MFTPVESPSVRKRGKWIEVLTVKRDSPLSVLVIGVEPVVVPIHFYKRSYLCAGKADCAMCEAGIGSQSMLFVAVWHKKAIALVRLAYRPDLCDAFQPGLICDISLPRVGSSYEVKTISGRDVDGQTVTAGQILSRIMVLHQLDPNGTQLVSAAAVWDGNLGMVRGAAARGAIAYTRQEKQPAV